MKGCGGFKRFCGPRLIRTKTPYKVYTNKDRGHDVFKVLIVFLGE